MVVYDGTPGVETTAHSPQVRYAEIFGLTFFTKFNLGAYPWNEHILEAIEYHIPTRSNKLPSSY